MGCSGTGTLGVYKLEMDLNTNETRFIAKVDIGHHDRVQASALIDFTLKYFSKLQKEIESQ